MEESFFETTDIAKRLAEYKAPRYEELGEFDVYMEQLVCILDKHLHEFLIPGEEKALTPSMINNYVQKKIIEAPKRKKYSKDQIIKLMVIGVLKQVLPISEISEIIELSMEQYPLDIAYNYFCGELENALQSTFQTRSFSQIAERKVNKKTVLSENVRSAVLAFANRIYVKKNLYYNRVKKEV
ncbi:DUF1836 domain-containing protein [bacterium]|nr:DUF1836 domain-containing protein [bacterium]